MAEGNPKSPKIPTKQLSDSDTSEWFSLSYTDSTWPLQGTSKPNHQKRTQLKGKNQEITKRLKINYQKAEDKSTQTSKKTKQTK